MTATAETSGRLLRLLSLLQTTREWRGPELAERLGVSARTVRNDVERLRTLGYPVRATRGSAGGYRLEAGSAMPPLLLDDEEAVAIAVTLSTSLSSVAGMEESALQALGKLRQVLPVRLRSRVETMLAHTERATYATRQSAQQVDSGVLTLLAAAAGDREVLRFAYADHSGTASERRVEPYRLVNLGRRWYLVAFDVERDDWRTFRVDRIADARSVRHRFRARALPAEDVGAWVAERTRQVQRKVVGTVLVHAPAERVEQQFGPWFEGSLEVLDAATCRVSLGGRSGADLAFWLGAIGADFEVLSGEELGAGVEALGARYAAAVSGR